MQQSWSIFYTISWEHFRKTKVRYFEIAATMATATTSTKRAPKKTTVRMETAAAVAALSLVADLDLVTDCCKAPEMPTHRVRTLKEHKEVLWIIGQGTQVVP